MGQRSWDDCVVIFFSCSLLFDKNLETPNFKRIVGKRRSLPHTIYIQLEREKSSALDTQRGGVKERCFFHVNIKSLFKSYICKTYICMKKRADRESFCIIFSPIPLTQLFPSTFLTDKNHRHLQNDNDMRIQEDCMYLPRLCLWTFQVEGSANKTKG